MEKIKQKFNNDEFAEIVIDDKDDIDYKPGLKKLLSNFLIKDNQIMCKLKEHIMNIDIFYKIAGYQ